MRLALSLRWICAVAASFLALYLVLAPSNGALYDLILFPVPDPRTPNVDAQFQALKSITKKDVTFRSADGRLVRGWFLELPGTKRVFLYSHGKGNNIYGKIHIASDLLLCGGSVLMYDYQGYGRSQGKPSVVNACDDAVAAYDYLIEKEHRKGNDIIAFGESLGCGITGQLVAHRTVGGVILHSGATSLMRAGRDTLFWLSLYPDWSFSGQLLDNIAVFSKAHPPLLIIHAKKDKTLCFRNAEDLYGKAIQPKSLLVLPEGGHCSFGQSDEVIVAIRDFLKIHDL